MKYIDEEKIEGLLAQSARADGAEVERVLRKSRALQRLSLEETAVLLAVEDEALLKRMFETAAYVKDAVYGKRVVLFAPLYISNLCSNACLYCAFKSDNARTQRRSLSVDEIRQQTEWLLKRGHKRILMVSGEYVPEGKPPVDYYVEAIEAIYSASVGPHKIKRVNINVAPLGVDEFRRLKAAGIGTYQLFQETYHEQTYRRMHPRGPKSDPGNRIEAVDRAFLAGIDDVGIGVLYGLYDYRFETLALLMHIEHLERRFNIGPHTISVPRIEPALGVDMSGISDYRISDTGFKKIVAVLRLAVPYTGIILSTRETPSMRDELFSLGVSQISAESRTSPGGYSAGDNNAHDDIQFSISDQRTLDDVMGALINRGFVPSFCAACYRSGRTGEAFMDLARPGTIKGKCAVNALITLKEYLDDFASQEVKRRGYEMIARMKNELDADDRQTLEKMFREAERGARDAYL